MFAFHNARSTTSVWVFLPAPRCSVAGSDVHFDANRGQGTGGTGPPPRWRQRPLPAHRGKPPRLPVRRLPG